MHYRHHLVFENNAALSTVQVMDGKVIVRVDSDSPEHARHEVAECHLFPLLCTRSGRDCVISASDRIKSVNGKTWEMIDAINRHGVYELPGASENAVQKMRQQINDALLAVGLKYRVVGNGTILKPEFIDVFSGI